MTNPITGQQPFPQLSAPAVLADGTLSLPWQRLLMNTWLKLGGAVPTSTAVYTQISSGTVQFFGASGNIPLGQAGTVYSIDVSGGTTGLTTSGGPITTSGTITLGGVLGVPNGGTGGTTATGAGSVVLSIAPTLTTPTFIAPMLGTPASGVLTNCTGLPLPGGITGTLGVPNGGTGLTAVGAVGTLLGSTGTALAFETPTALGLPQRLGQCGVPLVLCSSGTMGNNGALSGLTALPTTLSAAYVWLPAGAIQAASPAGWYYTVFSSATAGTVYQQTYSSGTPTIPGSPTPWVSTGPGAFTQTTGAVTAWALSIPGGTLGVNGALRLGASWAYSNSANNKTMSAAYGAFTFQSSTQTTSTGLGVVSGFQNSGATGNQASMLSPGNGTVLWGAIDSTAAQTLALTAQLANATDYIVLAGASAELLPRVA